MIWGLPLSPVALSNLELSAENRALSQPHLRDARACSRSPSSPTPPPALPPHCWRFGPRVLTSSATEPSLSSTVTHRHRARSAREYFPASFLGRSPACGDGPCMCACARCAGSFVMRPAVAWLLMCRPEQLFSNAAGRRLGLRERERKRRRDGTRACWYT